METSLAVGTKKSQIRQMVPDVGRAIHSKCVPGNAYILETLEGEEFFSALNGKYPKKYYPSVWVDA